MPADVILKKTYALRPRDISLSVGIGEGQFGTSDVLLDGTQILRTSGPIGKLLIGPGSALAGKDLVVRTVVNDVSTMTNRMSVSYQLTGGAATESFVLKSKVDQAGDLLVFEATFSLR